MTRSTPGRVMAFPRKTDCAVDGTYAQRSTVASRSSPAAAQRGAEGAGLDGGDHGRSTIIRAVYRARWSSHLNSTRADTPIKAFATSRIYTSLTDTTMTDLDAIRLVRRQADTANCMASACTRCLCAGPLDWSRGAVEQAATHRSKSGDCPPDVLSEAMIAWSIICCSRRSRLRDGPTPDPHRE